MASIGSATRAELLALPLLVFKVAPEPGELDQLTEIARRLGWLEKVDSPREEWRLTESGRAVRRPPSLAIPQVATRILSVANPVRTQAKDWLPLIALGVGAVAGAAQGLTTAEAVRGTSVAVLLGAVSWQFYGELQIVWAIRGWSRVQGDPACKPLTALYSKPRLVVAAVLDAAAIVLFALLIFGQCLLGLPVLALAILVPAAGLWHLHHWTIPAALMAWEFAGRPPSSLKRWLSRRYPIDA